MAYTFDSTADGITFGTAAMPLIGSMSLWFKPTWAQADGVAHFLFDTNAGVNTQAFSILKYSDNSLYLGFYNGGDYRVVVASANYTITQNAWNQIGVTWDDTANLTKAYLNGAQIGATVTSLIAVTTTNDKMIGNSTTGQTHVNTAADIAEVAIWNAVLTADEMAALGKRVAPSLVRHLNLVDYLPMIRDLVDLNRTVTIVPASVVVAVSHPPMIYPPSQHQFRRSATAGSDIGAAVLKVVTETLGLIEARAKASLVRRVASEVLGLVETRVRSQRRWRVVSDTLGLIETRIRSQASKRVQNDTLGLVETRRIVRGLLKLVTESLGLIETIARVRGIRRVVSEVVGLVEARARVAGVNRVVSEVLGLIETRVRRSVVKRVVSELLGLIETRVRTGVARKVVTETLALVELVARAGRRRTVVSETLSLTEAPIRRSGVLRRVNDTLGLLETRVRTRGIGRVVNESLRIVESSLLQLALVPRQLVVLARSLSAHWLGRETGPRARGAANGVQASGRAQSSIRSRRRSTTIQTVDSDTPGGDEP